MTVQVGTDPRETPHSESDDRRSHGSHETRQSTAGAECISRAKPVQPQQHAFWHALGSRTAHLHLAVVEVSRTGLVPGILKCLSQLSIHHFKSSRADYLDITRGRNPAAHSSYSTPTRVRSGSPVPFLDQHLPHSTRVATKYTPTIKEQFVQTLHPGEPALAHIDVSEHQSIDVRIRQ